MTLKIQRLFNPETKALILSDHGHNPWNELVKAHAQQQGITPSTAEEIITNLLLIIFMMMVYHIITICSTLFFNMVSFFGWITTYFTFIHKYMCIIL